LLRSFVVVAQALRHTEMRELIKQRCYDIGDVAAQSGPRRSRHAGIMPLSRLKI
jgi:hypothetical protein